MKRRVVVPLVGVVTLTGSLLVVGPAAAATDSPVVLHVGQVTRQDVRSFGASEPDTVVEPDVAVSPTDPSVAIAAAHDSRFADGGAVAISVAWTSDGGATWRHRPAPGVTTATGGLYERASDPVLGFGPDGSAYLSILVFNASNCDTGVAVLRSTDGGQNWTAPSYAHRSTSCDYSDDKNFLTVDTNPASPHLGRVYQFWTPFISVNGTFKGSPQVVRWSDDHGATWSATSYLGPVAHSTQNSQPMILADGTVVDTFYDFGHDGLQHDVVAPGRPESPTSVRARSAQPSTVDPTGPIYAVRSTDGGTTWTAAGEVTINGGGYAPGVRCCLFSATVDRATQTMYVAWNGWAGGNTDPVYISSSRDGAVWTSPVPVSRGDAAGVQRVNVDIAAQRGSVYVSYGTRTHAATDGGVVQQQLSTSTDRGASFAAPISIGPVSKLRYAARADGYFPGDYTGSAVAPGRLFLVWAVSSAPPPYSTSKYHQIIEGATLRI